MSSLQNALYPGAPQGQMPSKRIVPGPLSSLQGPQIQGPLKALKLRGPTNPNALFRHLKMHCAGHLSISQGPQTEGPHKLGDQDGPTRVCVFHPQPRYHKPKCIFRASLSALGTVLLKVRPLSRIKAFGTRLVKDSQKIGGSGHVVNFDGACAGPL